MLGRAVGYHVRLACVLPKRGERQDSGSFRVKTLFCLREMLVPSLYNAQPSTLFPFPSRNPAHSNNSRRPGSRLPESPQRRPCMEPADIDMPHQAASSIRPLHRAIIDGKPSRQWNRPCTDAIELSAWNFDRKFLQHDRFTTQERPLRGYPSKGVPPVPSLSKCDLWQASCAQAWTQPVDLLAKFAHAVFSR